MTANSDNDPDEAASQPGHPTEPGASAAAPVPAAPVPAGVTAHDLAELFHRRLDRIETLLLPDRDEDTEPGEPAWRAETEGEQRWAVTAAILCAIGLQLVLPARLTIHPHWVLPVLEAGLLLALAVMNPHRRLNRSSRALRGVGLALVAAISLANGWSAVKLVRELVGGTGGSNATALLVTGGAIWATNVIAFALWYWEWDRGGPVARAQGRAKYPDLLFPQMQTEGIAAAQWEPGFLDYLYVAYTNATAFSPTDTMPLSRWAKLLMMLQSGVSLLTVVLVVARAVNILQ